MRPQQDSEQQVPRSRKSSASDGGTTTTNRQKTFFLTRDPDQISSSSRSTGSQVPGTLDSSLRKDLVQDTSKRSNDAQFKMASPERSCGSRRRSTLKPTIAEYRGPLTASEYVSKSQTPTPSEVFKAVLSEASPTSISSQASEEERFMDEAASQAVVSSDEEADQEIEANIDDSAPQLIMPSINMPSRRPFTQRGKQLGRLKILVTGNQGSGRTSLIKSIVQLCEHIVHIDTVSSTGGSVKPQRNEPRSIDEIYASTKPYPEWWSDIDDSRILKRRKSLGNLILERNICFVDVTGSSTIDDTLAYIEQQLLISMGSINQPGSELKNLLSGRGGCQVDLVMYLVTKDTLTFDMDQIKKISHIANVVPLIAKTDLLSDDQLQSLKSALSASDCAIPRLPVFGRDSNEVQLSAPYCVSSANGPDVDNMDASLLMSPEYVQPLLSSDLATLVNEVFEPSVVEYLRYLSGKKLVAWYTTSPKFTKRLATPLGSAQHSNLASPAPTSLSHSGFLNPVTSEVSLNTSNSFALAKVADHTQREEHLAQLRLCRWASELQLSLQRERERYESIAQSERALWLVQKMGEEIREGQIVPAQLYGTSAQHTMEAKRSMVPQAGGGRYEVYDPLGLIRWQDVIRARGWVMLQVIGSFGVVGGCVIWLAKTFGWTNSLHHWVQTWNGNWSGSE